MFRLLRYIVLAVAAFAIAMWITESRGETAVLSEYNGERS
jgi:hypothetical protein